MSEGAVPVAEEIEELRKKLGLLGVHFFDTIETCINTDVETLM